jgi:hypothetical protein
VRYSATIATPQPDGDLVRFVDIEPALKDSKRLAWLMPILTGNDDALADARTQALARLLVSGLTGNALVDAAMAECP